MILHGSLVAAFTGTRGWRGALLVGPSGSGKSDLALRCVDAGWRLVADDRVIVWSAADRLFGKAPPVLRGLVELRGQGFSRIEPLPACEIVAAIQLASPAERQPATASEAIAGVSLPTVQVFPFEASAPSRLRRIVDGLARDL